MQMCGVWVGCLEFWTTCAEGREGEMKQYVQGHGRVLGTFHSLMCSKILHGIRSFANAGAVFWGGTNRPCQIRLKL